MESYPEKLVEPQLQHTYAVKAVNNEIISNGFSLSSLQF